MADRQEPTISQTGVWVDTETGKVVESEPEQGKLLVPPGGELDQRVRDDIAAAKLVAGQTDDEPADEPEVEEKSTRRRGAQKATDSDKVEKATE